MYTIKKDRHRIFRLLSLWLLHLTIRCLPSIFYIVHCSCIYILYSTVEYYVNIFMCHNSMNVCLHFNFFYVVFIWNCTSIRVTNTSKHFICLLADLLDILHDIKEKFHLIDIILIFFFFHWSHFIVAQHSRFHHKIFSFIFYDFKLFTKSTLSPSTFDEHL